MPRKWNPYQYLFFIFFLLMISGCSDKYVYYTGTPSQVSIQYRGSANWVTRETDEFPNVMAIVPYYNKQSLRHLIRFNKPYLTYNYGLDQYLKPVDWYSQSIQISHPMEDSPLIDVAVDSMDQVHLVFYDVRLKSIWYAKCVPTDRACAVEIIPYPIADGITEGFFNENLAISVDGASNPHIVYILTSTSATGYYPWFSICHAKKENGEWSVKVIESNGFPMDNVDIVSTNEATYMSFSQDATSGSGQNLLFLYSETASGDIAGEMVYDGYVYGGGGAEIINTYLAVSGDTKTITFIDTNDRELKYIISSPNGWNVVPLSTYPTGTQSFDLFPPKVDFYGTAPNLYLSYVNSNQKAIVFGETINGSFEFGKIAEVQETDGLTFIIRESNYAFSAPAEQPQ